MPDREKYIDIFKQIVKAKKKYYRNDNDEIPIRISYQCAVDILALLKEQDSEKKRIMKVIWDVLHEGFSIDTTADQDWVYEQIRHRIEDI